MQAPPWMEAPYDYAICVDCQYCRGQTVVAYDKQPDVTQFTKGDRLKIKCTHCSTSGGYPPEAFYMVHMWRGH